MTPMDTKPSGQSTSSSYFSSTSNFKKVQTPLPKWCVLIYLWNKYSCLSDCLLSLLFFSIAICLLILVFAFVIIPHLVLRFKWDLSRKMC
jgi:hypothetical protein